MSFNIRLGLARDGRNRWYRRRELTFDVIRHARCHLMGLQEAFPFQLDELLEKFPTFGAIADKTYGGRQTGTYGPILFDTERLEAAQSGDFWLAPEPEGDRKRAWDAAVPRICTWAVFRDRTDGSRLAFLNAHFDMGRIARLESAKLVVAKLDSLDHLPRLFTGDLNADESSDAAHVLLSSGLRDTFRVHHPDAEANTYHGFRGKGVRNLGKIDYVFCDDRWKVTGAEIDRFSSDGRFPSDHFPITARLGKKDLKHG